MRKDEVRIGAVYEVKVSGRLALVRIVRVHQAGGWRGENLNTKREVRIRTGARLRRPVEDTPRA